MISYITISDTPNGLKTRSVWLLMNQDNNVRKNECVLLNDDVLSVVATQELLASLFAEGKLVENGVRIWFANYQRLADELLNSVIFAVFAQLQAGSDLATIVNTALSVLKADPMQLGLYGQLNSIMSQASDADRTRFICLALTVAYGKLGQK